MALSQRNYCAANKHKPRGLNPSLRLLALASREQARRLLPQGRGEPGPVSLNPARVGYFRFRTLGDEHRHPDRSRRRRLEAVLGIEAMGLTVGDEAHVRAAGRRSLEVLNDLADDRFAEPAPLMLRFDSDIRYLEEQAAVADHPAHADDFAVLLNAHAEKRIGQSFGGALRALWAQPRGDPETAVVLR